MIIQEGFRTSVNIGYDIGEQSFLRKYLPTPSHAESIIGLANGFLVEGANASHIMIGPYGSGKSLLATVIANIVGKKVNQATISDLISKFNKVHQDVYESLNSLNELKRTYIPVILNGSYINFGENLIEKIQKELLAHDIYVVLPTERNNIIETISDWKTNYPSTFKRFKDKVKAKYNNYQLWLSLVEDGGRQEIEWFKKIYPDLTSGAKFDSYRDGNFQENLKIILEVLHRENIGLFIIHDEFGRFLQNLEQFNIYKTMQELQDVAEFVNRTEGYMQLLLISHKNMSQYMRGFNEEHQSEFQRIEKRYSTYFVESDSATYYRIVQQFIADNYNVINPEKDIEKEFLIKLKGFNLFPELNQHEVDNLVVMGCQPIHPITLFLLPRISRVFGQNERTLFTYLESDEPNGFKRSLEENPGFIYADSIFSYFFSENNLNNLYDESTESIIKTYQLIRSNLDARKVNAYRVIRFITLWEVTNSNSLHSLDSDLISFATGISSIRLADLLEELTNLKHVRYNRVQKKWELAEGSSVVVEELIEEKKFDLTINSESRINVFDSLIHKRYYLARDYNDEKNITRFMKVQFVNSTKFVNRTFNENKLLIENADGTINYIILDNLNDYPKVVNKINEVKSRQVIFAVLKNELRNIKEQIDNYIVVNDLLNDTLLLREYKNLKNELGIYEEGYKYDIQRYLSSFTDFHSNVEWFYGGKSILLSNELDLENNISKIMWELYPKTPLILNDSINRFKVVGIQKRSLFEVIDRVLSTYHEENIGIEGQGPDYLIYATVLKNNGVNLRRLNEIKSKHFMSLREDLLDYINDNNKASLLDLYNIANKEPYGIRPPLIPLFIVVCLRDKWDQLMFYRNNMFVPALEGEKIHEMFKSPENYEYVYQDFSEEMQFFLNQVEDRFKNYISEYVDEETQIIRVSSGLLNWLRSLPRQTQITNEFLDDEALKFKELIRQSEVNPLESIEELKNIYSANIANAESILKELESSHDKFKSDIEDIVCTALDIDVFENKDKFIDKWNEDADVKSHFLVALKNSKTLEDFAFRYIGTEIKDWSDVNFDLFNTQIQNDLNSLKSDMIVDENTFQLVLNNKYKLIKKVELSKKSEIIYKNLERILKNAGRNVPTDEINFIILKLMKEYIE